MSYATQSDMEARYGLDELIARTNRAGGATVDTSVLDRALADADAELNGYLASRYTLPLPTIPAIIVRIACDIARYHLWQDMASDEVRRRYEDARRLLQHISNGLVSLGLPASQQPSSAKAAAKTGDAPIFDRTSTGYY